MTQLHFEIFDVFTNTRYKGNGLAVVKDAQDLSDTQMQAIAREFNQSETVFVLPPENDAHSAKVRIFTPGTELPFAGHPTVGTAVMLASDRFGKISSEEDAIIVLEEGIGPIRIGVRMRPDNTPFAEFDLPKIPVELSDTPSLEEVSLVLGLTNSEIGFENHHPSRFDAGVPFLFVPVADLTTIGKTKADCAAMEKLLDPQTMIFVYCRETEKNGSSFHARMFAPMHGIAEDPATGSAAAAFAGVIMKYDQPSGGTKNYIIEQGCEMGRASEIHLELVVDDGLHAVRIGGHVVKVAQGTITV